MYMQCVNESVGGNWVIMQDSRSLFGLVGGIQQQSHYRVSVP